MKKINEENMLLGTKLMQTTSDVPNKKRIQQFEQEQNYLRNLTYRVDRSQRADPLVVNSLYNKVRYGNTSSSGYGRVKRVD